MKTLDKKQLKNVVGGCGQKDKANENASDKDSKPVLGPQGRPVQI